jgi:hypothetical protein
MSEAMSDALEEFAGTHRTDVQKVMRQAIADAIGWDLVADESGRVETRGRPRKYKNEFERKEAVRQRHARRRELTKLILEDASRQERENGASALEGSLKRRGAI